MPLLTSPPSSTENAIRSFSHLQHIFQVLLSILSKQVALVTETLAHATQPHPRCTVLAQVYGSALLRHSHFHSS